MTSHVPVVYELWSAFEASLLAQAKQLARDIARAEGADPKPLLQAISKEIKLQAIELPEPIEPTFCSYQLRDSTVAKKCLKPVLLGHTLCAEHAERRSPAVPLSKFLPKVTRFQSETDPNDIYFQKVSAASPTSPLVFSEHLKPVGILHDSKIIRFHYE
jgi:hypothetical protein